jgi:hypothetical protein
MNPKIDALRAKLAEAGEAGLTWAKMKPGGKSPSEKKAREAELRDMLAALASDGSIRGPFKNGNSQVYFAAGSGPTVDKVCELVERFVKDAGVKLPSKKALESKMKGLNKRYFPDALKEAASKRAILEVACGSSKYYIHREVAAERLGSETQGQSAPPEPPATERELTFPDLATVYRRLKSEQGGFTAVKIYDVINALGAARERVHELIAREAKAGRVTVHPTNSVNLPREVMEAALRLPGHAELFVTLAVREDP